VFISEYFRLARFLEPALLIVEDVDLIARERTHMHGPGEEMLLNKLLNEMDGLREDADVMVTGRILVGHHARASGSAARRRGQCPKAARNARSEPENAGDEH